METNVSVRRALMLALGEVNAQRLPPSERDRMAGELLNIFAHDPDPGIHSAAEWLLRRWGRNERLIEQTATLTVKEPTPDRQWYINQQGQTLSLIRGPVEFRAGSPVDEPLREGGPGGPMELQHHKRIERSFALMTHEVTVEQFLRFRPDMIVSIQYAREPDAPITRVPWYTAAEYCNWLSEQEDIPEDQWCYLPNEEREFDVGMKPAPNYLERRGYRLPTEAEWEYACAAGALTSHFFGDREGLLPHYVWYKRNSGDRWMLPVGSLKPNDLGMFDMLGNAREWSHEVSRHPSISLTGEPSEDLPDISAVINGQNRGLRGGSFMSQPEDTRSAYRFRYQPSFRNYSVGMRAARTLPEN